MKFPSYVNQPMYFEQTKISTFTLKFSVQTIFPRSISNFMNSFVIALIFIIVSNYCDCTMHTAFFHFSSNLGGVQR